MDPDARHSKHLAEHAEATVAVWRDLGLNATYEGLGRPRLGEGMVTLEEGPAGCKAGTARVGHTRQSWRDLPGGRAYITHSRVVICPRLYRHARWQWSATVHHELGHAAGLGHFDGRYRGSTQVMRWENKRPVSTLQAGDLNGLRFLAGNAELVRSLIPPSGGPWKYSWDYRTVTFTGPAKLEWYPDEPVRIVVTDEGGKPVVTTFTDDTDRFVATTALPPGEHELCLTAVSPVNAAARTSLGCVTVRLQ